MKPLLFVIATSMALLAGCAGIESARMQVPDDVVARSEVLALGSFGGGRKGQARVDGRELHYQREASRLQVFGYANDSTALRFQFGGAAAECGARRHELQVGRVTASTPNRVECQLGPQGRLAVSEVQPAFGANVPAPAGELRIADGRIVQVQASFRIQGTPVATGTPAGYLFVEQGRAIGAVDTLSGTAYLPRGDAALREACLRASLALSLMWMPD